MAHTVTLNPGGGADETVIEADKLDSMNPVKTHSGIADFRIQLPHALGLEDHAGDEIWIEADATFLFRGYVTTVNNSERQWQCTLGGYGIGLDLERTQTSYTFNNVLVEDAIQTVGNDTPFSWTVHPVSVTETVTGEQAQEANTTSEFNTIVLEIEDTDPVEVAGDSVNLLQTCFTVEGEDEDRTDGAVFTNNGASELSEEGALRFADTGDWAEWDFTLDYDIPDGPDNFFLYVRDRRAGTADQPEIEYYLDGELLDTDSSFGTSPSWQNHAPLNIGGLEAGTHTVRIEAASIGTEPYAVDVLAPQDGRYSYTLDDTLDSNNHLSGPELYPDEVWVEFTVASVPWSINEATLTVTLDQDDDQLLSMRLDGGTWFDSSVGDLSFTETFGTERGSGVQGRIRLTRHGVQLATPTQGINGQSLQSWEITFDGDDKPVINSAELSGNYLEIQQELHSRGRMRFWLPHAKDSKTAVSAERGEIVNTLNSIVNDRDRTVDLRNYYNSITVRGQGDVEATVESQTEINNWDRHPLGYDDATITQDSEAEALARSLLTEFVQNRETTGRQYLPAEDLTAGPDYTVTWSDGTTSTIPSEEVAISLSENEFETELRLFIDPIELGQVVPGLRGGVRNAKRGF